MQSIPTNVNLAAFIYRTVLQGFYRTPQKTILLIRTYGIVARRNPYETVL